MSAATLTALIAHCRALCRRRSQTPDAELLRRFTRQRDAVAFEELLERYAPLVWSVCRRMLPNEADCEDAFQATFLALVRKPGSIDPRRMLGGWLHTVAVRVARKAQVRALRQRPRAVLPERPTQGDVADEVGSRELFRAVDEEIDRLPALLRLPVLLCCLQGRTRDEAAEALGCSVAAVKSRLERGRNLLRRRLERRGIELPAAFLVLGLTGGQVRASLRAKALQSVLGAASPAVAALVPAAATGLTGKLTLTALSLLAASVLGIGTFRAMQADPSPEAPAQKKDVAPKSPQPPAAEHVQPLRDRFGDPLPPGAVRRFGTLRFRHPEIVDLAFTPDGKHLIAGSGRTPLAVFDPKTGRKLRDVGKVSANNTYGFALSPDGRQVACCGFDVSLWDVETGKLIRELQCGRCQSVAFSPDGKVLAAAKEFAAKVVVVETATGKRLAEWTIKKGKPYQYGFYSLAFSADGKFLAGLFSELREEKLSLSWVPLEIQLLDAAKGTLVRTFKSVDTLLYAFAFQPGSGRLASIEKDGILRFWDVTTGKEVQHFSTVKGTDCQPTALRFSADGRRCAVVYPSAGLLIVLDTKAGRELRRIDLGREAGSIAVALSPDGRTVAGKLFREACVRVWDVESGTERLADAGHRAAVTLSLSADGRTLISRGVDGQVFRWDLRNGEGRLSPLIPKAANDPPRRTPMAWTTRGPRWQFTINGQTSELEVRSLDSSQLLRKTRLPTGTRGSALSPDGTHLAVSFQDARHTVYLWNPEKEEQPRQLTGHPDACQQLLFSHDGKRLIAGAGTHNQYEEPTVWIWDVATARLVRKLATNSAPGHMLLTHDDRILLTGGLCDAAVRAWDMETGKLLATLADPSLKRTSEEQAVPSSQLGIAGLFLSADERFLAVVSMRSDTSAISVWETASWKLVRAFAPTRPRNHAQSGVFSRDGRFLFVANSDSTILEWDVSGRRGRKTDAPSKDRLNGLWRTLTETPDKAYPAVWEMLDHATESVPFLKDKLSPVEPIQEKRVRQLLDRLDSESFPEREEASRQLRALGEQAVPLLRQALKERLALETKKRIEGVIEALTAGPSPEQLRLLRALAVLEWSDLAEADEHLRRLADGAPSASLTRAAKAALRRR
jgi:RNA polymerase sigma factor (sigma-70 family)